jgi:hypothetical protein
VTSIGDRLRLMRTKAGRWAVGPLVVRIMLFVAGLVALGLAAPTQLLLGRVGALVVLGAVLPALAPRGRLVSAVLLLAAFGWLASTTVYHADVVAIRLVALAGAMYLVHTLAALAAVLPYDAVLPPGVVGGWLFRAAIVVAISAVLGIAALVEAPVVTGPGYLAASLIGVVIVAALLWALTRAARRR